MNFLLQTEDKLPLIVPDSVQKARLVETVDKLMHIDYHQLITTLVHEACWIALKIVLALAIYTIGKWLMRLVLRIMDRSFERHNVDESLRHFLRSLVSAIFMLAVVLIVVETLGVNTTSFIALFASAGLAIGMALSGTLQNFAGGVVLLLLRPYKVGDYVVAQGQAGSVDEIGLFSTRILTTDNRVIYVPNNSISSSIIDNYTQKPNRRLEWNIGISYGDDVDKAREAILALLATDERVLLDPVAAVYVASLDDSAVTLTVRAWVATDDYWSVFYAMNEAFYKELPKHGVNFPFPQMDVHVKKE